MSLLALNGYVHYRIGTKRVVTWHWAFALSVMDAIMLTAGLLISGGFSNTFFVLYYPALAMFAVVFTSMRLSIAGVTLVAVVYTSLSLIVEPGVEFEIKEEKVLFTRIVVMYAVVGAVNLVSRFERIRRREAVERERQLQQERIDLSQTIHDTIAQSRLHDRPGSRDCDRASGLTETGRIERQAAGNPCAGEIDNVGVEASNRHRPHF